MLRTPNRRPLRAIAALLFAVSVLLPAAGPLAAQEKLILRVGTTQDLDSINPFETALVVGFEVFTLNYELLTAFDQKLQPSPGFADSWTVSDDGLTYTFKIDPDKKWSDGTPATADDAVFTYQLILDSVASDLEATGLGYLDAYVTDADVKKVEAPDPQTFVVTLGRANDRILKTYVPILPQHVWKDQTPETVSDFLNDPPIVGTGPYQAVEWQTGQFVRFEKNPNWSHGNLAADEVVIQIFKGNTDTMVQALRSGDLDYAHNVNADQFNQLKNEAGFTAVAGTANGFTELGFNTYGTGTGKTIEGGGPSTKALLDPAFRDALGYAIDKDELVDKILGGYGEVGTTQVPPFQTAFHKEPATPRTFSIDTAKQKLDAAGYALDASGKRLDKEGNPIALSLVFPDSDPSYSSAAQFLQTWFGELGVTVSSQQYDSDTLVDLMLPPEAGDEYKADYDMFIWGWGGDTDPNSLLDIFRCEQIGNTSDSLYCNPRYDELFTKQNEATTPEERKTYTDEMQEIIYNEAPYHVLFYDASLDAYRNDKFAGWQNQPDNGVPLFGYGSFGYTVLTAASDAPSPEPSATAGGASGGPSSAPTATPVPVDAASGAGGSSLPIILGAVALVVIVAVALVLARRRTTRLDEE